MEDLSLHILDIAENSINAGADFITIEVYENREDDFLSIEIRDNGSGIDTLIKDSVKDPFVTTKDTRDVGLGISLLDQAAQSSGGKLDIQSREGKGTSISASFEYSHIDRKPLGNIESTLLSLIVGNPEVEFKFVYKNGNSQDVLETKKIKDYLNGDHINSSRGISILKECLKKMIN